MIRKMMPSFGDAHSFLEVFARPHNLKNGWTSVGNEFLTTLGPMKKECYPSVTSDGFSLVEAQTGPLAVDSSGHCLACTCRH